MAGHSSAGRDYRYPRDSDPRTAPEQDSDPLAELARLIGQADPFINYERPDPHAAQAREPQEQAWQHDQAPQDQGFQDQGFQDQAWQDDTDAYQAQQEAAEDAPPPPSWLRNSQQAWRHEPEAEAPAVYEPHPDDRYYVETQRAQTYGDYPQDDPRYEDTLYGRAPAPQHYEAPRDPGPPYAYPGHERGYDDYDTGPEETGSRRRGGLVTVFAVLALAVIGTAGAFAYRSYTSGPPGEPPVIRADASPSKVVPPAPSKDPSGKVITDRIGETIERLIPREEQPVEVASAAPAGPRVVFPPLVQQTNSVPPNATSTQPATQANAAMSGGVMDEPRRIRTVSIRPDQPELPVGSPAPDASAGVPVPPPAVPVQTQRVGPGNGPIQLAPQGGGNAGTRTAAVSPAPVVQPGTGGYLVQVSSQRSEADAQASFRAIQARYSSIIGSRPPVIRRADLAAGTYYRAMVGPFATSDEASQLCASLKAAGGVCLVQRN